MASEIAGSVFEDVKMTIKDKWPGLLIVFLFVIAIGCLGVILLNSRTTPSNATDQLPSGAENIRSLGNDWIYFELVTGERRNAFMFRRVGIGYAVTECITEVGDGWREH